MAAQHQPKTAVNILLGVSAALTFAAWLGASDIYARWDGVPPVPTKQSSVIMGLGDQEFAYRFGAITLQNLGDTGGQVTPLKDYDYEELGKWFALLDQLDPVSDHVPMLAAFYFGATLVPKDVRVVYDYLARIGDNPAGQKWRWLVHAIFLARHRLDDLDLALNLAYKLAKMQPIDDTLPGWARQMPALVLTAKGDHQDAKKIIEDLLLSSQRFHPNEVNFMRDYLINQLGVDPAEVKAIMTMRGKAHDNDPLPKPTLPALMPE